MEIRPVDISEIEQFKAIQKNAFVQPQERIDRAFEREVIPNLHNSRALVDKGQIKSVLMLMFPHLWLGCSSVVMAGLWAVATPPEYRRQGYFHKLMIATLREMRDAGCTLSGLYPFYFPAYKKYGYEQASTAKTINVKMAAMQKFKARVPGQWVRASPDDWAKFNALYEQFCVGRFGCITRDQLWWQETRFGGADPHFLYLWYDEHGGPQAYVIYNFRKLADHELQMGAERVWLTLEAYYEVLAFLAIHDSQAVKIEWRTTIDDPFVALLDDPRAAEETLRAGYMLRILDVKRALEERSYPETARGRLCIQVDDDMFDWNTGVFEVEFAGGKAAVRIMSGASSISFRCDVRRLAQMYAGFLSPVALAQMGLIDEYSQPDLEIAQAAFSRPGQPASHMPDHF